MRLLSLIIFILAGASIVYFNDGLLSGFLWGGEKASVPRKVSVVKPKSLINNKEALKPISHQFTFFETLNDETLSKYVGLHGEMLPVSLPAKPVLRPQRKIPSKPAVTTPPKSKPKIKVEEADEKKATLPPRFAVQVSSFRDAKMAGALKMKLQKRGFDAFLIEIELPNHGGKWHRVFLGRYSDETLARKAAESARQEYKLNAVVVRKTG